MKATEILMEEHRLIERVLDSLEDAADRLSVGQTVAMDFFIKVTDFIKGYADGYHHFKEEGVLFAAMAEHGISQGTEPLSIFLEEHQEGRHLARAIRESAERVQRGDSAAMTPIIRNTEAYVTLLREHIQKEDHVLFPMADNIIPMEEHQQLAADFNRIEYEEMGQDTLATYLRMVDELARQASR